MKRIVLGLALALCASSAFGQAVTQTGAVAGVGGQTLELSPITQFAQNCNNGAGGIVGQTYSGLACGAPVVTVATGSAGSAISVTNSTSTATSLIAKASPGNYYDAYCQSSVVGRCIVYNATTVPGAGALTAGNVLECVAVPAAGQGSVQYNDIPRRATLGIVVLFSSAVDCNTYTVSATAYIHASVQ